MLLSFTTILELQCCQTIKKSNKCFVLVILNTVCYSMLSNRFSIVFHCIRDVPKKLTRAKFCEVLGLCPQLSQFQMPQFRNFIKTEASIIF